MKRLFLLLVLLITQFSFSSEGEVDPDPWEKNEQEDPFFQYVFRRLVN